MIAKPKNIYYMLTYAYQVLREGTFRSIEGEEFDNIHNLFAEIITLGVSYQIKRGLAREYQENTERIGTIRGKIELTDSLREFAKHSNKLVCTFDEYTIDSPMNRVLKTTMDLLVHSSEVKREKKAKLKNLLRYFTDVERVDPRTIVWSAFSYHRNNATYKMLMNLCYLVIMGMLLSEKDGTIKLADYLDDQKMHALYERFILEYFKKEYPELKASRDKVAWNLDDASNSLIDYLPEMQTDITIRYKEKTLIIDAKYYSQILKKGQYGGNGKILSSNMYQIYSYVKNMDKNHTGNVEGMLLYAGTDEPVKEMRDLSMDGNKFHVRTLDLSGEWSEIKHTLDEVASDFKRE